MMGFGYMGGVGGMGIGGWFWLIVLAALVVVPFWRLLPRYGIPAPVALIAVFPLAALVLLWVIAFKDRIDGRTGGGGAA